MGTVTITIEKYDELVRKANLLDLITELHENDTYFMSDVLSNMVKAQKNLSTKVLAAPTIMEAEEADTTTIPVEPF
jgi:hypothetical protein